MLDFFNKTKCLIKDNLDREIYEMKQSVKKNRIRQQ